MLAVALGLYVGAWFLPPLYTESQPAEAAEQLNLGACFVFWHTITMLCSPPTETMDWLTWKLMGLTGATNFAVPLVLLCVQLDRFWLGVGIALLACGLLDSLWMYWLPMHGDAGLDAGYYLWMSSIWLLGLTCCASARFRSTGHPRWMRPNKTMQPTDAQSGVGG